MKRTAALLAVLLFITRFGCASAETPPGFGYVNTDRTNVRTSVGGPIVTQLNDGDAVYVLQQQTDSQGRLWYQVNTEFEHDQPATVWVQARFVTTGSELFHDIVQVAAGETGLLALRSDGTVAGVADENTGSRVFQGIIAAWRNVSQVACGYTTYLARLQDGSLRGFGNLAYEDWDSVQGVRLLDANSSSIVYVTQDGVCNQQSYAHCQTLGKPLDWPNVTQIAGFDYGVLALYADGSLTCLYSAEDTLMQDYGDVSGWQTLAAVDCGDRSVTVEGAQGVYLRPLLVGLHTDGTVCTLPARQLPETEAWRGITAVKAGWDFIIGLRADGTAVATGGVGSIAQQVAQWTDITAIDASMHYCVGLKTDGTLVFAGEYVF